jgi:hypothetical protein
MNNPTNQASCPFCKNINTCMAKIKTPCWCNEVIISTELTKLVPSEFLNKSCICNNCVNLFNENPQKFKNKYLA